MPAYPHKIAVQIGEETVYIRLFGDEHAKHAESIEGYTLLQKNDCWYYAEKDSNGEIRASPYRLTSIKSQELTQFLSKTPKHLKNPELSDASTNKIQRYTSRKTRSALGNRKILIILMQFADVPFVKTQQDFNLLFNGINYTEDHARGSVYDYYNDVSYSKLQLTCDIIGPFTSQHNRDYYGKNDRNGNDQNPIALFEEAMEFAAQYVRFNEYDADNDGYIDNVHIVFAGHGEEAGASSNAIWSHEMSFNTGYPYQDMLVDRYSCAPELRGNSGQGISRIGPHCHEIGHALGAMDFYDTNYERNGYFEGTGQWDIMASGSWNEEGVIPADFNPYVKMVDFGWVEIPELPKGQVQIFPSSYGDNNYYLLSNAPNDYYLIENRTRSGWGEGVPGEGLLFFHIHPNVASSGNDINSSYPQKCYPVCASSNFSIPSSSPTSYGNINSEGCPFPGSSGKNSFSATTTPSAFTWNGALSHIDITEIKVENDGSISLFNRSEASDIAAGSILFQEGFESSKTFETLIKEGITDWSQNFFSIYNYQKGMVTPHTGEGYLRFRPNKNSTNVQESTIVFQTQKSKEEKEAILSLFFSGSPYRPEEDMLSVTYSCDDKESSDTISIRSNLSSWNNFILDLPTAKSYKISVCGRAVYGQSIYIDDIEVIQKEVSSIREVKTITTKEKVIYNLQGRKLPSLQKGLNIIRKDGVTYKVLVK